MTATELEVCVTCRRDLEPEEGYRGCCFRCCAELFPGEVLMASWVTS